MNGYGCWLIAHLDKSNEHDFPIWRSLLNPNLRATFSNSLALSGVSNG
ncbi:hypothetical protein [Geminocystis sp. GBBB08]|nr:hypothetical protein [Geminocystis sp. GBBB08]